MRHPGRVARRDTALRSDRQNPVERTRRRAFEDRSGIAIARDVGGDIFRPMLGSVETDDPNRVLILPFKHIVLESDGGPENTKLWAWYRAQGFKPCRGAHAHSMYAPLSAFIPELQR
jgi:hypothetical protein